MASCFHAPYRRSRAALSPLDRALAGLGSRLGQITTSSYIMHTRSGDSVSNELSDLVSLASMTQTLAKMLEEVGRAAEADDLASAIEQRYRCHGSTVFGA